MQENAHKYGFFLRFPKGKEEITGYQYESWHYRYCGIECATYIHDTKITFEEYYEYFIRYHNPRNIK
jgi:D-alanyl-D-alanine carboxypeptidase